MNLYVEIKVWKRISEHEAIRYSCLHDIASDRYAVQSADFLRLPFDAQQSRDFDKQFVELFIEVPVAERDDWFDSLAAAIESHDRDFA